MSARHDDDFLRYLEDPRTEPEAAEEEPHDPTATDDNTEVAPRTPEPPKR